MASSRKNIQIKGQLSIFDFIPESDSNNISGKQITDDYIKENPSCFYVFGHYLDKEQGWHKVPEELPIFKEWTMIDVVCFGLKTNTPWMEHEKWEAKDWTFRSIDSRRNMESIKILAWKASTKE